VAPVQPLIPLQGEGSSASTADLVTTVALTPLAAAFLTIAQLGVVVIARMFLSEQPAFWRSR
jgi:hypothetical protein